MKWDPLTLLVALVLALVVLQVVLVLLSHYVWLIVVLTICAGLVQVVRHLTRER